MRVEGRGVGRTESQIETWAHPFNENREKQKKSTIESKKVCYREEGKGNEAGVWEINDKTVLESRE